MSFPTVVSFLLLVVLVSLTLANVGNRIASSSFVSFSSFLMIFGCVGLAISMITTGFLCLAAWFEGSQEVPVPEIHPASPKLKETDNGTGAKRKSTASNARTAQIMPAATNEDPLSPAGEEGVSVKDYGSEYFEPPARISAILDAYSEPRGSWSAASALAEPALSERNGKRPVYTSSHSSLQQTPTGYTPSASRPPPAQVACTGAQLVRQSFGPYSPSLYSPSLYTPSIYPQVGRSSSGSSPRRRPLPYTAATESKRDRLWGIERGKRRTSWWLEEGEGESEEPSEEVQMRHLRDEERYGNESV
ncbi:hypothetical protein H2203_002232 [Taxawa tesnikishii (nom. ined.)]|nr:hypothetical protein H2203_002232 [Dothideales sp. JES 119]